MNTYLLVKSLHIISFIAWMAGMLYLPRLFVYHAGVKPGSEQDQLFQTMERRLLRFIMNPAMIATFIFGFWLIHIIGFTHLGPWFHAKATCLILLVVIHGLCARWRKEFINGTCKHSPRFFKIINEVPTVMMIAIVFLVVMKPF